MIQAIGLTSTPRKESPPAVDDVSFEAPTGRITALLGVPGSGKSTTLRLMLELQRGRGVAHFLGRPLHRIAHPAREVGVVLGEVPGHPARTVRGHLRMLCAAAGVTIQRADDVLETVGLVGQRDEPLGILSRALDRRLAVACALLADPHTLVLDAPTHGLSARDRSWLHGVLRAHTSLGGTVLFTTDDAKEAARNADRVVTLGEGRVVADQEATDFARTRLRPRVAVRSPHAARLGLLITQEARSARRSVEVVQEGGNRLSVYGSSCADVGDAAYRHGILVHQLADETGDMGPGGATDTHPAIAAAAVATDTRSPHSVGAPISDGGPGVPHVPVHAAPEGIGLEGAVSDTVEPPVTELEAAASVPAAPDPTGPDHTTFEPNGLAVTDLGPERHLPDHDRLDVNDHALDRNLPDPEGLYRTDPDPNPDPDGNLPAREDLERTDPNPYPADPESPGPGPAELACPESTYPEPAHPESTHPESTHPEPTYAQPARPEPPHPEGQEQTQATAALPADVPDTALPAASSHRTAPPERPRSQLTAPHPTAPRPTAPRPTATGPSVLRPPAPYPDGGADLSLLPPAITVRSVRVPLRPLRYELRRAAGIGAGYRTGAAVFVTSVVLALFLARNGHTSHARLLAAWPVQLPLPPAALGAGLLGALAFGDEFRHPALAVDRGNVPRRLGLLGAKLAVAAATALLLALLTVGCDALALHLVYGQEVGVVPPHWPTLVVSWGALVIGCAWAGVLAAGIFKSTAAGLAAVVAVPVLVGPAVQQALAGPTVRTAMGLPARLRDLTMWPFGTERYLAAGLRMIVQPVGSALTLSLTALLCAYLLMTVRSRAR
ncbi:ATP-binding cassette domain-containing protein [Streptomyces uncialis]|uniref:ATP-binding cassette domain-containing protein n=1 Tax=Streptomyces uncialis TaxID=1048205 RepID=UPI00225557B8|nr:ATP-binding cassette domain-containing protein [Streptomyces uncialis]MCX4659682.1 ATP-binding cassette domain-containing protein [Streptomyces uncialis]